MAYGAEFYNSSGNLIIDTTWPNPQVVESSTYSTASRGSTYPSADILSTDIVVARPIRTTQSYLLVMKTAQSVYGTQSLVWSSIYGDVGPTCPTYAYYRLREGVGAVASGYGLVVYEDDGVTPTFSSNGVEIHYEIAATFSRSFSNAAWFNIPSGDDINDYFCVLSGTKTVFYLDSTFGTFVFHGGYLYDYVNNRIQAIGFDNGSTYFQGDGIIGKILT